MLIRDVLVILPPLPVLIALERRKTLGHHAVREAYDSYWYKVRQEVLQRSGIPRDQWSLYDVDHNPPYNKDLEPDHRKYTLIPMLKADHSHKTATEDVRRDANGKFIKKK